MCLESYVLQDNTMHGDDRCGFVGTLLCDTTIDAERLAFLDNGYKIRPLCTNAYTAKKYTLSSEQRLNHKPQSQIQKEN
jgi:hypothetical protein